MNNLLSRFNLNAKGVISPLILIGIVAVIGLFIVLSTLPIKDKLLGSLFPKSDSHAAGVIDLSLVPSTVSVSKDKTFLVDLAIDAKTEQPSIAQLEINFNPQVLQAVTIEPGFFFNNSTSFGPPSIDNVNGKIFATLSQAPVCPSGPDSCVVNYKTGTGILATIQFKALNTTSPTSSITFNSTNTQVAAANRTGNQVGNISNSTVTITDTSSVTKSAQFSFSPASGTITGSEFPVQVMVKNDVDAANLFSAKVKFDQTKLEVTRIDMTGSFITQWVSAADSFNNSTGIVSLIGGVQNPGYKTDATPDKIATVYFRAKASGSAAMSFEGTSAVYRNVDNVDILASSGTGTYTASVAASPTPTPTASPTPTPSASPSGTPSGIDLVVTDISWTPANPTTGTAVRFSATVKNQGTAATPQGTIIGVLFSVNGTAVNWSDTNTASLAAGASVTLTANGGPGNSANWTAGAGVNAITALVDDVNRIAEANENNNSFSENLVIAGASSTPSSAPSASPSPSPIASASAPVTGACTLTSASWVSSANPIVEGRIVNLKAVATGNCAGQTVVFSVFEDDGVLGTDDAQNRPTTPIKFNVNNEAVASWLTEFQTDGFNGINNPPEYFFRAQISGTTPVITSGSPELQVTAAGAGTPIKGDSNRDNKLDLADLSVTLTNWNKDQNVDDVIDTNDDGVINTFDFAYMIQLLKVEGVIQ